MKVLAVSFFCSAALIVQAIQVDQPHNNDSRPFLQSRVPLLSQLFNEPKWDELRGVVLFIGSSKTGSNLVGSILNAHPNIVMANNYQLLSHLDKKQKTKTIYHDMQRKTVMQAALRRMKKIKGAWQGSNERGQPHLIGDNMVITMHYEGKNLTHQLKKLVNVTRLPLKLIHVVVQAPSNTKNSATMKSTSTHDTKMKDIQYSLTDFLTQLKLNPKMLGKNAQVVSVDFPTFTANPLAGVPKLCSDLEVECSTDFVQAVSQMIKNATPLERATW